MDRLARYNGDKKPMFVSKRMVTVDEFASVEQEQQRFRQMVTDIIRLGGSSRICKIKRTKSRTWWLPSNLGSR